MVACTVLFLTTYYRRSSLRTLSSAFQSTLHANNMSTSPTGLSAWLQSNKASFLADVKDDGAKKWTIVMGNEAGGKIALRAVKALIADLMRHTFSY